MTYYTRIGTSNYDVKNIKHVGGITTAIIEFENNGRVEVTLGRLCGFIDVWNAKNGMQFLA